MVQGEDRGPQVAGTASLFLALSTIAVFLRCYCRLVVVKAFGVDDYLSVVAWLFFAFFCGFAIAGVKYGTGRHAVDIVPPTDIPIGLKWWWACEPVYVLSNMALKFSIGIFLLRLAVSRIQRIIIYVVMGVSGIVCTMYFFLFVFQCNPPKYFWEQFADPNAQGTCLNTIIIIRSTYAYSAMSCWSDWTYCILPGFMVWNLNMNIRTKISVIILLSLSAIASAATIARFPYIGNLGDVADFLYATTDVAIWSISETGLGITASAAATLRPLMRTFLSRSHLLGGSTTEGTNPWPVSKSPARAGYLRSGQKTGGSRTDTSGDEEIALRHDLKKNTGVTTVVDTGIDDQDTEFDGRYGAPGARRERSEKNKGSHSQSVSGMRQWNDSDDKLADGSEGSDAGFDATGARKEVRWSIGGIRKTTTVSTKRI